MVPDKINHVAISIMKCCCPNFRVTAIHLSIPFFSITVHIMFQVLDYVDNKEKSVKLKRP